METMFTIGKIVNTHGVKGELKVVPMTDEPQRFSLLKEVFIQRNTLEKYEIQGVRYHKNFVLLKLKGVEDMDAGEFFKNATLKIERKDSLPLKKDEYYISDLYDLEVYTEEGRYLGIISDIIYTGSNDVYVVKRPEQGKDLLLPAIKEVIKEVNLEVGKLTVKLLEGLEDL
ncbi:16S rRNA processing protein RimM [Sporanaerobium hydrogeniformans]|uniref:16S rRNA processing protein RimM n=1 Tax=Sporanaerobium hydrogeniformans TaxID=3072179 RepID=A0AC61DCS3_9FIRM|nr:ribosome maturation factor RimM [Sporanaerobium hydrogeniformans]PHV71119.1 16S rRNA processing protein RimM [Sporanaerobium hydrogeniformans]